MAEILSTRTDLGWKPRLRFRGIGILPMVIGLAICTCGFGEEVGRNREAREGSNAVPVIQNFAPEDFARAYADAASTAPEKFWFDEDGRLETTSGRVALLESVHREAEQRGGANVAALSQQAADDPTSTPNERIVALRNVALHSPGGRDDFGENLRSFLAEPELAERAPFAFLQALDGVVYLEDATFVPVLDRLAGGEGLLTSTATMLALQRLATVNAVGVIRKLNADPALLGDFPAIRADLVASADPSDPVARAEMEKYLWRGDVSAEEKSRMIQRMDQPAFVVVDGIFTGGIVPPGPPDDWQERVAQVQAEWGEREEFREMHDAIRQAADERR